MHGRLYVHVSMYECVYVSYFLLPLQGNTRWWLKGVECHYSSVQFEKNSLGSDTASVSLGYYPEILQTGRLSQPMLLKHGFEDDQGAGGVACLMKDLMLTCRRSPSCYSLRGGRDGKEGGRKRESHPFVLILMCHWHRFFSTWHHYLQIQSKEA